MFSESEAVCPLLETHGKIGKNMRFPYSGNLTVTDTRYPDSDLIQATDSYGLDRKKIKSLKFSMHPRPSQTTSNNNIRCVSYENHA